MHFLQIDHLTKSFPNGVQAVEGVSLAVARGECVALLGPSGAGKSTFLRLIAGLEKADAGSIAIAGRDIHNLPPHERNIAFISQRPALYPHLNVRENLAIGQRLRQHRGPKNSRLSEAELQKKVAETAALLRLETLLNRYCHELSGGEQRRVALGRGLVRGADLWLLDEPFGQLDQALRLEIAAELPLLRGHFDATMILVTHDLIEALALANRIGVLGGGRLLQVATPQELLQNPGHRTVAASLGWPPMNFIAGKSEPKSGSVFCFHSPLFEISDSGVATACSLGVFPADLQAHSQSGGDCDLGTWTVRRVFVQNGGAWLWVERLGCHWFCPRFDGATEGTTVQLWVRRDRLHWFAGDGCRLSLGSREPASSG